MKKITIIFITIIISFNILTVYAEPPKSDMVLNSPSAILIDGSSGRILYDRNAYTQMYPASITKIMTGLLALENSNINDMVTASPTAISSISLDSSNIGMLIGEEMSMEHLLYALLVASANEAANVIAEDISGSIGDFVELMNQRAKELGTKNTHFTNTNGLPNDEHYTTAYDMALIAKQAMTIPEFRKIVATSYYEMPPTNKYSEVRYLSNTNYLINKAHVKPDANYIYPEATGIKTGWTSKANHTLVASAKKGDLELITVVMGSEKEGNRIYSYEDTIKLFDYGFNNYSIQTIISPGEIVKEVNVLEAKNNENILLLTASHLENLMPKNFNIEEIENKVELKEIVAPIKKGDILGTVTYSYKGFELGKLNLVSDRNVEKEPVDIIKENAFSFIDKPWVKIALYILGAIIILIIILFFIGISKRRRRYSSRRNKMYVNSRRKRRYK
jgi:D-alanyl-D-alanine carboxypeptidase (penicillin-binding protein 5/6)